MSTIRALIATLFGHKQHGRLLSGWCIHFAPIACPQFQAMLPKLPPELRKEAEKGQGVMFLSHGKKTYFVVLTTGRGYQGCQS